MDLVTFLVELAPSFPPESLRDWAFLAIIIPMIARLYFFLPAIQNFRKLFPSNKKKAFVHLVDLKIPGFNKFLYHQISILLLPGVIALPILIYFGLDHLTWPDLPSHIAAIGVIGLFIWIFTEFHRAKEVGNTLKSIVKDLQIVLDKINSKLPRLIAPSTDLSTGTPFKLLTILVSIRKGIESSKSWAESQSSDSSETNFFPFIGSLGREISTIIEELMEIPQAAAKGLISSFSDNLTVSINNTLEGWFSPYITPNYKKTAELVLRSVAPSIWLGFLVWYTGITV
jgi:hypothetical protein